MKCPICFATAKVFASSGKYQIYKCSNCGFGFTENLKVQRSGYHRDETYIEEEDLFKNIFGKRFKIISKVANKGSVLEVGCSTGLMLSLFKDNGWKVVGVEVSKKAARVAEVRGVNVIVKPFEDANFTEKFDVVIFNHTLEHLADPRRAIKKAVALLKVGGVLYIDLPNFDSFSAKLQKGDWPLLLPGEHLWHFTYTSLRNLLSENKMRIIFDEEASGLWDLENPLAEVLNALLNLKKRFLTEIISSIPSFVLTKFKLGSDLMVIAKKN